MYTLRFSEEDKLKKSLRNVESIEPWKLTGDYTVCYRSLLNDLFKLSQFAWSVVLLGFHTDAPEVESGGSKTKGYFWLNRKFEASDTIFSQTWKAEADPYKFEASLIYIASSRPCLKHQNETKCRECLLGTIVCTHDPST